MGVTPRYDAAIFDMDGLLVESESKWRIAEFEVTASLGIDVDDAYFESTMGMRMAEIAVKWFRDHGLPVEGDGAAIPPAAEVAARTVARTIELVIADAEPLPGVLATLDRCRDAGLRVALCSSSDLSMIEAITDALGIGERFEIRHSAQFDAHGKPHPEPYLVTAAELGVAPGRCLVFEDSLAGCVSATAAGMSVVAVPGRDALGSGRFGFCALSLASLDQLDGDTFDRLCSGVSPSSASRPRFHLAIGVDDLDRARTFYGDVLGCAEGRSAETWIDFDLFGHQVVVHLDPAPRGEVTTNDVDGKQVPAEHFGALLPVGLWRDVVDRLRAAGTTFLIEPNVRFAGEAGEQHTTFVLDPAGNALEFKAFADDRQTFAP